MFKDEITLYYRYNMFIDFKINIDLANITTTIY